MKTKEFLTRGWVVLSLVVLAATPASAADKPPHITSISVPQGGATTIIFHGTTGPFRIQKRVSIEAPWLDVPEAQVTEVQTGVFMGLIPRDPRMMEELAFYRVASEKETVTDLKGWTILVQVSAPANRQYFVPGESPVVTVNILDTFAQGITRADFSSLNLYLYGPQDPRQTVTAVKLLNASTDRSKNPHHYIDLKTNPDVKVNGTTLTYPLRAVTDEAPGTYTASLWSVLAADNIQQIMKFADLQIGTSQVESPVVAKRAPDGALKCAGCHEGPISGKMYLHHVDVSPSRPGSVGNWSLDYEPVKTCKSCHNNDGYAAYPVITATSTNRVADPIIRRVHGVHMGADLKLPFNTNSANGSFKEYVHVEFPADVRNCTTCHLDDRWKTEISRLACGTCHDNSWFGPKPAPDGWLAHAGGAQANDNNCLLCHDVDGLGKGVAEAHKIPPPGMDVIDVALTPPANGKFYVAGEKPAVTLVFKDDAGKPIDHTKVADGNFSTASLFVYGPRSGTVPVLTSTAKNVNSKLRASVSSSKAGPWSINGKLFRIAVNGSAPQDIKIVGASTLVTAAEVVASLNSVITNLNGGAKASVSGANVNIRTLIQGANARFEIYNGEVTTAMGWKRGPNTVLEPDVTIAAGSMPSNDLRALSDPLDYSDPMVTRTAANITYQLDDVAGLTPGTYGISVYLLPRAGKIAGLNAKTGLGHLLFQVGTATPEKKIATNCTDCHGDTIWHLNEGPIHAAPFNTDYCKACHDYGHVAAGDMFKNQGGTSLSGWSGYGAMPIVRRVHGVHRGNYLEHPEEIYANATVDTFGHIIFPQDIRNCTKCHAESDTWKQEPSRMACLACHDSDAAKTHAKLLTYTPDPDDPYGATAVETCVICHGAGSEFSPDKVHSLSNPYRPPYPRAPREEEFRVLTPLEAANVSRGGALYDAWWAVTGAAEPSTDHPLWASRPDSTSNTRKGSITWRCKECHGWDYKGVDGAYGSGSHRTGIRGIFGTPKTAQEVFDLVKTGHTYGAAGLSDANIWDLVKFVVQGQIDTKAIIDTSRKFTGSTVRGETLYKSGIGSSTACAVCHGADGLTPPPDYPAFTEYPGKLANENPWEFQHKVRFGQPGTPMPSVVAGGATLQDVADVSAYCQTLPQTRVRPAGKVARGGALYNK
ncbi:MAG: hypothetical protein HYY23_09130 [Verrucomicrobia bacterium]|nr:hypothetical protein [Verrucomicrobiota bacterium]